MIYIMIGLIVGLMMGITGAGGALIAIPLFITFLHFTLKEATILSLIAVILGTIINLFGQKNKVDHKMIFGFVIFGAVGNFLTLKLKAVVPDLAVASLLALIVFFSLWNIWRSPHVKNNVPSKVHFIKIAVTGSLLGVITTLTGLGGGVLLLPILIRFGKTYEEAIPTSLAIILFISMISFLMQGKIGFNLISLHDFSFLTLGTLSSFFLLKFLLKSFDPTRIENIRKSVFTLVTMYSMVSILLKIR